MIEIPENMVNCQAIYFYNPALPDQQAFPPTVRLVGGTKYPVYRYDASDTKDVTKAKEAAFIQELEAYVKGVTDVPTAQADKGNYNMCEFVSDKYLSSTSARGVLKGIKTTAVWNKGDWREAVDTTKYGVVQYDGGGNPIGIAYTGLATTMECFEMFYDALSLYSGFNMDDPTSEDYRNQNQFIFRFIDRNVLPGRDYRYTISAYNCTLLENANKTTLDIEQIPGGATVPVQTLRINNGDEGHGISVGQTYRCGHQPCGTGTGGGRSVYAVAEQSPHQCQQSLGWYECNRGGIAGRAAILLWQP